jgi:hypothetical protein
MAVKRKRPSEVMAVGPDPVKKGSMVERESYAVLLMGGAEAAAAPAALVRDGPATAEAGV